MKIQDISSITIFSIVAFAVAGCGTYGSSFQCKDANGLHCMPVRVVDQRINNGQIVEVELNDKNICKGKRCYAKSLEEKPDIKSDKVYKIKLRPEGADLEKYQEPNDFLYVK